MVKIIKANQVMSALTLLFAVLLLLIAPVIFPVTLIISIMLAVILDCFGDVLQKALDVLIDCFSKYFFISIVVAGVLTILGVIHPIEALICLLTVSTFCLLVSKSKEIIRKTISKTWKQNANLKNDTKNEYLEASYVLVIGFFVLLLLSIIIRIIF